MIMDPNKDKEQEKATVLVVDDEESVCVTLKELLKDKFYVLVANSALRAIEMIKRNSDSNRICNIDLVLSDICMASLDGIELLKRIKEFNPQMEVIMITGQPSAENTLAALKLGASDYIVKPFKLEDVLQSIQRTMQKRKDYLKIKKMIDTLQSAIHENYSATTDALILTIDAKDHYTKEHCERVSAYMVLFAQRLGLDAKQQDILKKVSMLHDIGKIGVREEVLNKPGKLSPEEWEEIKNHSFIGYQIVKPIEFLGAAREILLYHQERYDGKGYPGGLEGEEIPLGARMLAIVDSYDAMVTDRPYRKALSNAQAIAELLRGKGTQFDPELVDRFVVMIRELKG